MAKPIGSGETAPAFKLLSSEGETVGLKDFKGKKNLVLIFYCKNNTPG